MSFEPVTMLAAATAVQGFGSLMQGEGNARSAEYNAAVARQNAIIAQQQGQAAAEAQSRDAARKMGSMIAAYGASGVQVDAGSPLDVLADSARMAELDNLTVKYNYALKAQGFGQQAGLDEMGAQTASTAGLLNAAGSGLRAYGVYTANQNGTRIPNFG